MTSLESLEARARPVEFYIKGGHSRAVQMLIHTYSAMVSLTESLVLRFIYFFWDADVCL